MVLSRNVMRAVLAASILGATLVFSVGRAEAACHRFTVEAAPASPGEGGKVTVTVRRDAAVRPSHVQVSTIDGTAKSPADYPKVDRTVNFTNETSQQFSITIANDTQPEGAETFRLHLSKPGGCEVNTNFVLDPDVVVTIKANDRTPAPTSTMRAPAPTVAPLAQPPPSVAPSSSPTPAPTLEATVSLTPSPSATLSAQAAEKEGRPTGRIIALALAGAAVASALALMIYRRFVG